MLEMPDAVPEARCVGHRKLLYLEKLFAAFLLAGPQILGRLRGRILTLVNISEEEGHLVGYRTARRGLEELLVFWLPAVFRVAFSVRECYWEGRVEGTGKMVFVTLSHCLLLLVQLLGKDATKEPYVRTISCALLTW